MKNVKDYEEQKRDPIRPAFWPPLSLPVRFFFLCLREAARSETP